VPRTSSSAVRRDLRARLEAARLDALALFRALDQMALTPVEIPQRLLRQLFELDADCAEALWVLDQPSHRFDLQAMRRDTLATLDRIPRAQARFREKLSPTARHTLETLEPAVRRSLRPAEAYNQIPGRDPHFG
jgi:hypothetical protein